MLVTITTDASFQEKHNAGAFAFWISSDAGKVKLSGPLRRKVHRPEQAEFRCIINAMHVLSKQAWKVSGIIINTDCLNVIHLIEGNKREIERYKLGSWGRTLVADFNKLKNKTGATKVQFRHVRSHVSTATKREWVNDWCDTEAKRQLAIMLTERENIKP